MKPIRITTEFGAPSIECDLCGTGLRVGLDFWFLDDSLICQKCVEKSAEKAADG